MTPPASATSPRDYLTDATVFKEAAYIGGEWVGARSMIAVRNPANGETIGHVPDLGADETHGAIAAASAAFPQWRALPAAKRSQLLEAWYPAIGQPTQDLARLLTIEPGKTPSRALSGITYRARVLKWFAEGSRRVDCGTIP